MIRNITEVRLLNVPLESDYKHTLYFDSKSEQETWFKNQTMYTGDDFSYIRKDGVIRYPKDYDDLTTAGVNYVMYRNTSYSNKWYYAFITKIEFVNDGVSLIHFETDVIQTWFFDYVVQPSFVEREHVAVDRIGENTIPEGLELGEYTVDGGGVIDNEDLMDETLIIASTVNLNAESLGNVAGTEYGGVFSGVRYYEVTPLQVTNILKELSESGKVDAITGLFIGPKNFVESSGDPYKSLTQGDNPVTKNWTISKPSTLHNGYKPRNNKLFTYPYCYLLMDNNAGASAIYHYDMFSGDECRFKIHAVPTPGFSVRLIPSNYKDAVNNMEGLNLGKFPICSWTSDIYTNWLTQNSVNIKVAQLSGAVQTGLGLASVLSGNIMGGLGSTASGLAQIGGVIGQVHQHSLVPPQAEGNLNNGDVTFATGHLTFTAYKITIKREYLQIIDSYFDMFGYKVNRVHTPNKNHRENYWFTKTIDVNIDGNVPMDDMLKIKNCYNTGITFWKNPANIGKYTVSNEIV